MPALFLSLAVTVDVIVDEPKPANENEFMPERSEHDRGPNSL